MNYGPGEPHSAASKPPSNPYKETSKGRTRQSDLQMSDINTIMAKYQKTGELPTKGREAFFANVSEMPDFRTALDMVHAAEDAFMSLPASMRARFENDPAKFLDFTTNPANRDELVSMGLLDAPDEITEQAAEAGDAARDAAIAAGVAAGIAAASADAAGSGEDPAPAS